MTAPQQVIAIGIVIIPLHVLVINDKNVSLHLENRIKLPERKGGRSRQSE